MRCAPPLAHVLRSLKELGRGAPSLEQVLPLELVRCVHHWRTCYDHCRSSRDELHPWRTCCEYSRRRCDLLHHWRTCCDPCRSSRDVLHHWRRCCGHCRRQCNCTPPLEQAPLQELARYAPPRRIHSNRGRSWRGELHHWHESCERAQRQDSLERHVLAGYAEGLEPEPRHGPHAYLAPLLTDEGRSTVGPARMGATITCLDERVLTEMERDRVSYNLSW